MILLRWQQPHEQTWGALPAWLMPEGAQWGMGISLASAAWPACAAPAAAMAIPLGLVWGDRLFWA